MSSTSTYSRNVADTADEKMVQDLTQAVSRLQVPATSHKKDKTYDPARIWRSQIKLYLPLHPNAAKILSRVKIPPNLTDHTRLQQFVSSTSITSEGEPFPPRITELIPRRLYLADQYSGTDKGELIGLGITHVVCLGQADYHDQACPKLPCMEHAILRVPTGETLYDTPLVGIIDNGISFLRKVLAMNSGHKVLIHCKRGDNWGPSMAIGTLMDFHGCSFDEALSYVLANRPNVSLHVMVARAVQQWWTLEKLRPELPKGRGYRPFKWAGEKE